MGRYSRAPLVMGGKPLLAASSFASSNTFHCAARVLVTVSLDWDSLTAAATLTAGTILARQGIPNTPWLVLVYRKLSVVQLGRCNHRLTVERIFHSRQFRFFGTKLVTYSVYVSRGMTICSSISRFCVGSKGQRSILSIYLSRSADKSPFIKLLQGSKCAPRYLVDGPGSRGGIPSHIGIRGNETVYMAAKESLNLDITASQVPYNDLKCHINHFISHR